MGALSGFELLSHQAGELVASNVKRWTNGNPLKIGATPIETLFGYALEVYEQYHSWEGREVLFSKPGEFAAEMDDERSQLHIYVEQQVDIGGWRVDFVVHYFSVLSTPPRWLHLIVECDGHDFHERTKEQAARDRTRDRAAAISGLPILRFTGMELWTNPLGCAEQVMHWFLAESDRLDSGLRKA